MRSLLPVINTGLPTDIVQPFAARVARESSPLRRGKLTQLQINLGKLCNQSCTHCHVEAGPTKKRENMDAATARRVVELTKSCGDLQLVDLTGGAPEMNPMFRELVQDFRSQGLRVIDRCNLTILRQPGFEWAAPFLADHQVDIVASLPCYLEDNVDGQRGDGVFRQSIDALRQLNDLGYAADDSALRLDLVFNPTSPSLPPDQANLQADYKRELLSRYGIRFNHLLAITNIPIKRYAMYLAKRQRLEQYMKLLEDNFNCQAAENVMCRSLLSVAWDGSLYDCDFNQMIDLPVANTDAMTRANDQSAATVWNIDSFDAFSDRSIATADHCYGCTAGAGSSCGGALL
ncbi:arsenosugar biosynthesis radical SAM protein ArsS [Stieleria sp. TO1_6]|uniref:arsenosugar biosynthesis radical SAM (seleno)protein ArsS n=1 Tax=Stieleria tagensis TaxID=2956795 RepID=UPI00209A9D1A|nr:arsenosugar biosynthesis radical SAM (seleno)protein ArsS [Stieleria tagensis]MCO8124210.1 arsenosugar biosynthesis radical SAM protein ArsS [Stieleria tagensis]